MKLGFSSEYEKEVYVEHALFLTTNDDKTDGEIQNAER